MTSTGVINSELVMGELLLTIWLLTSLLIYTFRAGDDPDGDYSTHTARSVSGVHNEKRRISTCIHKSLTTMLDGGLKLSLRRCIATGLGKVSLNNKKDPYTNVGAHNRLWCLTMFSKHCRQERQVAND